MKFKFFVFALAIFSSQAFASKETIKRCDADKDCVKLAEALYFEARGEPKEGIIAVGQVIINRTERSEFDNTITGVVEAKRYSNVAQKWICQFSYICELMGSKQKKKINTAELKSLKIIARGIIDDIYPDYAKGAVFFASSENLDYKLVTTIGDHKFYDTF